MKLVDQGFAGYTHFAVVINFHIFYFDDIAQKERADGAAQMGCVEIHNNLLYQKTLPSTATLLERKTV